LTTEIKGEEREKKKKGEDEERSPKSIRNSDFQGEAEEKSLKSIRNSVFLLRTSDSDNPISVLVRPRSKKKKKRSRHYLFLSSTPDLETSVFFGVREYQSTGKMVDSMISELGTQILSGNEKVLSVCGK
jgi:hypothetical protein